MGADLEALTQRSESKTLEWKRDLSSPDGVLRTICAFSNSAGGTLVIGVEDRTRRIRGIDDPLGDEERLVDLVADNLRPQVVPEVGIAAWKSRQVLVVRVYPGPTRPYFLKSLGQQAGTFVRVGSSNRLASAEVIAELKRWSSNVTFDEQPAPGLDVSELDFAAATATFAGHRKLRKSDLGTLRLVTDYAGRKVPTNGGILLFGSERLRHFPDAWLQVARFATFDRSEIVEMNELREALPDAIEAALAFVKRHASRRIVIRGARREEHPIFPPVALREAIVNAVVHTDYSQCGSPIRVAVHPDRVEVENPGLLAPGLTVDDLRQGVSKLRNRVLGRVFHEIGLIEQWGSGIQRMSRACREAGLPEPEFQEIGERFRLVLRNGTEPGRVDPRVDSDPILAILERLVEANTSGVAKELRLTTRAARLRLKNLVDRGLVVEIGMGPNDPHRTYRLAR